MFCACQSYSYSLVGLMYKHTAIKLWYRIEKMVQMTKYLAIELGIPNPFGCGVTIMFWVVHLSRWLFDCGH